jgi:hypothetical protein
MAMINFLIHITSIRTGFRLYEQVSSNFEQFPCALVRSLVRSYVTLSYKTEVLPKEGHIVIVEEGAYLESSGWMQSAWS